MLYAAETLFVTRLSRAFDTEVATSRDGIREGSVQLGVEAVEVVLPVGQPHRGEDQRISPPCFIHRYRIEVGGDATSFVVPEDVPGQIIAVESPPGWTLRPEDEYRVQLRTILLQLPPVEDSREVLVRLRGAPARGRITQVPCCIKLNVHAVSSTREELVRLLRRARAVLLQESIDTPNLAGAASPSDNVQLRLLTPVVTWLGESFDSNDKKAYRGHLRFQITGLLETHIILGAQVAGPRIRRILVAEKKPDNGVNTPGESG